MRLNNSKGLVQPIFYANEKLDVEDLNVLNQAVYTNSNALLASLCGGEDGKSYVHNGLELKHSTAMTCLLSAGSAISYTGAYITDGIWGFIADRRDIFSVFNPIDVNVSFDTGGTYDRIDSVEIKPAMTPYDFSGRDFKDPVTGIVITSPTDTKLEYGYDFYVNKGDDTAELSNPTWTWTIATGTIGSDILNEYILFSTDNEDYYVWFQLDDDKTTYTDPEIPNRVGIVAIVAATSASATAIGVDIQLAIDGMRIPNLEVVHATGVLTITLDRYADIPSPTNGTMGAYFDPISFTNGNGAEPTTAGSIKVAEVRVLAGATSVLPGWVLPISKHADWQGYAEKTIAFEHQLFVAGREYKPTPIGFTHELSFKLDIDSIGNGTCVALDDERIVVGNNSDETISVFRFKDQQVFYEGGVTLPASIGIHAIAVLDPSHIVLHDDQDELQMWEWTGTTFTQLGSGFSLVPSGLPYLCGMDSTHVAYIDSVGELLRMYEWDGTNFAQTGSTLAVTGAARPRMIKMFKDHLVMIDDSSGLGYVRMFKWDGTVFAVRGATYGSGISICDICRLTDTHAVYVDSTTDYLYLLEWHKNDLIWTKIAELDLPSVTDAVIGNFGTDAVMVITSSGFIFKYGIAMELKAT